MDEFETIVLLITLTAILIFFIAVIVFRRPLPHEKFPADTSPSFEPSINPPSSPRQDLHLPGAVSVPPNWMLNEEDQPFDIRAFYSPISPDQNAAPLYLEALAEFHGDMAVCFPEKEAAAIKERFESRGKQFPWTWSYGGGRPVYHAPATEVDKLLATFESGFKKISEAQKYNRCVFHNELSLKAKLPHHLASRKFAQVASLRVRRHLEVGEVDLALQILSQVCRLGRDLRDRGSLIGQLNAVGVDDIAGLITLDILSTPGLAIERIDRLIAVLVEQDRSAQPNPLAEGWKAEYVLFRDFLHDLECGSGFFSPAGFAELSSTYKEKITTPGEFIVANNMFCEKTSNTHPVRWMTASEIDSKIDRLTASDWKIEIRATSNYYKELIRIAELPYLRQSEGRDSLAASLDRCLIKSITGPTNPLLPLAITRAEAIRGGYLCLAGVRRWELTHWFSTSSLESACKEAGLDSVPIDPFSGNPMQLTKIKGKPVVYSVGPDGKDDGGLVEWTGSDSPGDIVFRVLTQ